jgi:hypothetical protein
MLRVKSQSMKVIRNALSIYENANHISIVYDHGTQIFTATMHQRKLHFQLNQGSQYLACKDYPGMVLDTVQSFGTLTGLKTRLVLRSVALETCERIVLVPKVEMSAVSYELVKKRVSVTLDSGSKAKNLVFKIDTRLGRLQHDGSWYSQAFVCFLHALTSHCLPDSLTKHTGVEQAQALLKSSELRPLRCLSQEDIALGFSGTNDSQCVLPLSIEQTELASEMYTNAKILNNFLQVENTVAVLPRSAVGQSDSEVLLQEVVTMDPPVQVIIDVGSRILDRSNVEVAARWLDLTAHSGAAKAVIFLNQEHEFWVMYRSGTVEPLQGSSMEKEKENCLVYFDGAHTIQTPKRIPRRNHDRSPSNERPSFARSYENAHVRSRPVSRSVRPRGNSC